MSNYVGRVLKKPSDGGWEGSEEQAENRAILTATASYRLDLRIQQSGGLTRADHATSGACDASGIRAAEPSPRVTTGARITTLASSVAGGTGADGAGEGSNRLNRRTTARGNRVGILREARVA